MSSSEFSGLTALVTGGGSGSTTGTSLVVDSGTERLRPRPVGL